ncbi:hypothetical protein LCGC14_1697460 [marine sediment metagenome]|uniref:Uncharacterized protein n=1 Tax=marine sediment metagenome TaxID=412755 RepID=A0A0F9HIR8_9ZZZZ
MNAELIEKVEDDVFTAIWNTLDELRPHTANDDGESNVNIAKLIISRIKDGSIPNVTINY